MTATPQVSVVIACYNYGRYLAQAIDSALAQNIDGLQIIVVDDGSTDETPQVLQRYGGSIEPIRQANRGLGAARNAGIARCRGKYLLLLDADDALAEGALEHLLRFMEAYPEAVMAYGRVETILPDGRVVASSGWNEAQLRTVRREPIDQQWQWLEDGLFETMLKGSCICVGSCLVRMDYVRQVGPLDERHPTGACDAEFWWRLIRCGPVGHTQRVVTFIRRHDRSLSRSTDNIHRLAILYDYYLKALRSYPELTIRERAALLESATYNALKRTRLLRRRGKLRESARCYGSFLVNRLKLEATRRRIPPHLRGPLT